MENTTTATAALPLQELYTQGQYLQFINKVMEAQSQFPPAQYHLLLGTAYAKQGELAVGRYHLEKAKQLGANGTEVQNNLAAVRQQLAIDDLSTSKSAGDQFIYTMGRIPQELYWSASLLLLLLALIVLLKSNFKKVTLAIVLALLATGPTIYERTVIEGTHFAVSLQESSILEGPSKIFGAKTQIPAGALVIIGRTVDNWVLVKAPLIYSGWVDRSALGLY